MAVPLGLAQLVLIAWADANLARRPRLALEGGVFLAYMALVGWMLFRFVARSRATAPACPHCHARLEADAARAALMTGRCVRCGADIIEMPSAPSA